MQIELDRILVAGDLAGHQAGLESLMSFAGISADDYAIPDGTKIIQTGNLVHPGPHSEYVLDTVAKIMEANPKSWVQLLGNYEANYLANPRFVSDPLPSKYDDLLNEWWESHKMRASAAVQTKSGSEYLVTHAGVTFGFWESVLARPKTAADASARLQALESTSVPWLWMTGSTPAGQELPIIGPLWANAPLEVYDAWYLAERDHAEQAPFNQIHGHSGPYQWATERWLAPPHLRVSTSLLTSKKVAITHVAAAKFISVTALPTACYFPSEWAPLVLEGSLLLPEPTIPAEMDWLF